jgi:hypothetical protein
MNKELVKKENNNTVVLENMTVEQLQRYAEQKSSEILLKIENSSKRIKESEDAAEKAKELKSGWFGKTGKKTDQIAKGLFLTNAAVVEMNNLLQESIRFTCTSVQFAQVMHKTMASMVVSGFKDSNGNIHELDSSTQEFAQHILDEADDFTKKQLAVEKEQAVQNSQLLEIKSKLDNVKRQKILLSVISLIISVLALFCSLASLVKVFHIF